MKKIIILVSITVVIALIILSFLIKDNFREKEFSNQECEEAGGTVVVLGGMDSNASWNDPCPDNRKRLGIVPHSIQFVLCCK
jgi:hypothetical protein